VSAFHARQFTLAATEMAQAYDEVIAAGNFIGVPIAPPAYRGQTQPRGSHNYDPVASPNALNVDDETLENSTCGC
jgi:hypothetical protein